MCVCVFADQERLADGDTGRLKRSAHGRGDVGRGVVGGLGALAVAAQRGSDDEGASGSVSELDSDAEEQDADAAPALAKRSRVSLWR